MKAQYIIRLDDFCPTNNIEKWERFFKLFDTYDIKPIIAVIPDNKDPKLQMHDHNNRFWDYVRSLDNNGYKIALHGYQHTYVNENSGIFKINDRSEFAGLTLEEQQRKIKAGYQIFLDNNIAPEIFVAPAHSFDNNTLKAIKSHTKISIISDGLLEAPYQRRGFNWIPVQLSEALYRDQGVWTFNYHPEQCTDIKFNELDDFIQRHHHLFVDISVLEYKKYSFRDLLTEQLSIYNRFFKRFFKRVF